MRHILSRQIIGGKYLKCIVILQAFYLKLVSAKAKKLLTFVELVSELPGNKEETIKEESWEKKHFFLIATTDPWYGTLIIYVQTQRINAQFFIIKRCPI